MFGFKYAFKGLFQIFKSERNFKVHCVAFLLVVILGLILQLSKEDWIHLFLISGLVISLEAMNSVVEKLCDLYSKKQNSKIKVIKDGSAAAVLIAAIFAIIIGIFIFLPYF